MRNEILIKGIVLGTILCVIGANVTSVIGSCSDADIGKELTVLNKEMSLLSLDNPSWQWAVNGGGTAAEDSWSICLDAIGNTFITGSFEGTAVFGSTTLVSNGSLDVFVAKLNSNGDWQWAVEGGGTSDDEGRCIGVDTDGNTYITGYFKGTAVFGSITLISQGYFDVFVAKLNSNGDWQWAVEGGGTGLEDLGLGICVDTSGNTYITGYFMGTAEFGSTTLTSSGICDVFVAKLSTNGDWQWAVQSTVVGTGGAFGYSIFVDTNGNTYVTGYFSGTTVFGSTTLTCNGLMDVFVAKLSTNGDWQWAVQSTVVGTSIANSLDICMDTNDNTYITGLFIGTAVFGSTTLTSNDGDVFVAKLSPRGDWQWAVKGGGTSSDAGTSLRVDSNSNINVTGMFSGTAVFGSTSLVSSGGFDVFVAKLNSNGFWQWAVKGGGTSDDIGRCIGVDSDGNTYITGSFSGTAVFGSTTLVSSGGSDAFVAKLSGDVGNQPPVFGTSSPLNGSINNPLNFSWSIPITDPEGNQFSWTIQCSNGQTNSGTGATNGTKILVLSNLVCSTTYTVWVNATDPPGSTRYTRGWFSFTTKANSPPYPPTITGPAKGKIKVDTEYNFTTTDPDGDDVSYFIDWGDGTNSSWIGPYLSGDLITESHTWSKKGDYTIRAKAKDIYGNESGWGTLDITMPFSYNLPFQPFWERLFERFPHVFPILRHLLGY